MLNNQTLHYVNRLASSDRHFVFPRQMVQYQYPQVMQALCCFIRHHSVAAHKRLLSVPQQPSR